MWPLERIDLPQVQHFPFVAFVAAFVQARAVGCGFVLAEALGATGRFFQDFGRPSSRSLREALLNPRFRTQANTFDRSNSVDDVPSRTPTPPVLRRARRDTGAAPHLRPCQGSLSARESVTSGLLSASEYELQQTKSERLTAEEARSFCRHVQLHLCFAALHVFKQEHGHLPLALDRDQANEVVRIAEELLEIGRNVRGGHGQVAVAAGLRRLPLHSSPPVGTPILVDSSLLRLISGIPQLLQNERNRENQHPQVPGCQNEQTVVSTRTSS